ncbi:MAG: LytR C-terminal domain-containing protein [Candidatus Levybacteria bacterium]|nr:LytR C-terminal domain-containing protein [Candidatus Levybacteria bacterium]
MDASISFSKIVATPRLASWSQVYNAGKLFVALSIEKVGNQDQTKLGEDNDLGSLNILGKSLLDKLEQEFFSTETKDLESIKHAISATFEKVKSGIIISFVCCFFREDILYTFILGKGNVLLLREGKLGKILSSSDENTDNIASSSGLVKDNDLIVLGTDAFSEIISPDDLFSSLEKNLPSDATEQLAPKIHKTEDGRLAAIIIKYNKPKAVDQTAVISDEDQSNIQPVYNPYMAGGDELRKSLGITKSVSLFIDNYPSLFRSWIKRLSFKSNPKKIVFLIISIVITIILISSILSAIKNQNNAKANALFNEIYPQAEKKFDEGQSLLDLNRNYARDSYLSAQKILQENQEKFEKGSKEEKQIQDLLAKINNGLSQVDTVKDGIDRGKLSISVANGSGIEGTAGKGGKILKELGYNVVSTENADNYNYIGVTIKVKKDKSNFLDLLKKDLMKSYTVTSSSSDLNPSSPSDALIIIGK